MNKIEELRSRIAELTESIVRLSEIEDITPEDDALLTAELDARDAAEAELKPLEVRAARVAAAKAAVTERSAGVPNFIVRNAAPTVDETRGMNAMQLVDAVTRSVEAHGTGDIEHVRGILKRHTKGDASWARNLLVRSSDVYVSAWTKLMTGRSYDLDAEERAAIAVGTNTQGGVLVPTHLDPSIMLTNTGSSNAIRALSRVVTLSRENTWNGVTSAGLTMSWDAELAEVSDDSPSFAAASVPTYVGAGFVQVSNQAFEDIENLASDVLMLFADGKDRLEAAAHATGSGSAQPTGIFTAITGSQMVVSTTAATIGLVDLQAVKRSLTPRFRSGATWVMAPVYSDAIKTLGTALSASYTTDLTSANTDRLLGRPVVESDEAPTTQTTTVKDAEIIFGDFSNFLIVDKPGSTSLQYIPALFNTANNLPDGRSGWYMRFRSGSDSVNDAAFRLLADKTSA